ncbi:polymorphic toxin-type HINT domain-containing protein [Actinomadura scrupuli]|uniref:polymorphic toxin-type HINT domain-containing protein n=1 Tax=Actinomadura scrupuli TaxID=559629 RepID=UPI003D97B9F7
MADAGTQAPRAMRGPGRCVNSFISGTKVLLADGSTKSIEDVKAGDEVLATDPTTGKTSPKTVLASFGGETYDHLVQITIDTPDHQAGVVIATEHHLFWDKDTRHWVRADRLHPGQHLRTLNGTSMRVTSALTYPGHPTVRDLTIADVHTFYVEAGHTPVLVHNSGGCPHLRMDGIPEDAHPYIENVVRQMDEDGTLPPGVRQGKSKIGDGIYGGEGLPQQAPRYYVETDIFPTAPGGTRPDGRLVFGLRGEIYYSRHYTDGFIRIRGPFCGC